MVGTIIGGLAQIGSTIYGAAKSAQMNNKARRLLQSERQDTRQWYDQKLDEDYMSRTDVQAALTNQKEILEDQYRQARATQAVAGGTDEAVALQKEAANKSLAETTRGIAAQAADYKNDLAERQLAAEQQYGAAERESLMNQGNAIAQAASQAGNALSGAGASMDDMVTAGKAAKEVRKKEA